MILWSANHEVGNLSEWTINGTRGGTYNSGLATTLVSTDVAHGGHFSCKMTIDTANRTESGCRQFRHQESVTGSPYYYSVWYYVPIYYAAIDYWNLFQFKSETPTGLNDPFWVLDLMPHNGAMRFRLRWKGVVVGPFPTDTTTGTKYFDQSVMNVPVGKWFHVEAYLKQASDFSGRLTIWQDGAQLWDMVNVKTKYPGGDNRWSVNNYSDGVNPSLVTLYIDDAIVSTTQVGKDTTPPAPPTGLKIISR